jgi:lysophospholipase L1-like esterase
MKSRYRLSIAALALTTFVACSSDPGQSSGSGGGGGTGGAVGAHPDAGSGGGATGGMGGSMSSSFDAAAGGGGADFDGESRDARVDGASDGDAGIAEDASAADASAPRADAEAGVAGRSSDAAAEGGSVEEAIHYYGRWNQLADRAITVNTGSHVVAQFSGTAIAARFDITLNQAPNPTLAWRIDQGTWQEGELAASLPLGTGLSSGPHEVTLMVRGLNENQNRWSPPLVSSITFLGFDVMGGAVQPSLRPVRARIEFLGDSITEGINTWTSVNGQTTPCWRDDGRLAFSSQTAQLLGAEWRQVGFGRQGLLIVGNGGVPVAAQSFGFTYVNVPRDAWQPDMVVINEGTNDGATAANLFQPAYAMYLSTIRAAYPNAKIVAMRPFNGSEAAPIQATVQARNAAGDARAYYVDTTGWLVAADFTDGLHPNPGGATKAAQALMQAIRTIGLP